jgi:hypothetical protein
MFNYKLKKGTHESYEMFVRKELFIKSLNPKNKGELDYGINIANSFNNMLILRCRYTDEYEQKILNICSQMNININKFK